MKFILKAVLLAIAIVFHLDLANAQCTITSGAPRGSYLSGTGDAELDHELRLEVRRLEKMYHVTSQFGFYDDSGSPNANAQPGRGEVDGVVRVGVSIVNDEIRDPQYGPSAVVGILAHEYAHVLQFQHGVRLSGPEMELQADYIAGWYIARQSWARALQLKGFASSLYDKGDWNFYSPRHHGTPDQRFKAVLAGYKNAERDLDEIFELSEDYVTAWAHFQAQPKLQAVSELVNLGSNPSVNRLTQIAEFATVSLELGTRIADTARDYIRELKKNGTRNKFQGGVSPAGMYSDCSHFVHDVLEKVIGHAVPYVSTSDFNAGHTPEWLTQVPKGVKPQLGDIMVQGGHMAIYVGDENGAPMGAQLASKGGPSIKAMGTKGYFPNPEDLRFYRLNASVQSSQSTLL